MSFDWLRAKARNVYSQWGEDGVVDAIFEVIKPLNRWCFECGAADGLFFSNTRRLVRQGWDAILVEQNPNAYARLIQNCSATETRARCRCDVLEEMDPILAEFGAPRDIDLVCIDIDGQDYHLFNSMLRFRPRVVVIEFDPNAHPDFVPERDAPGQAGHAALLRLAEGRLYAEVFRSWCNLVLVTQPLQMMLKRAPEAPGETPA